MHDLLARLRAVFTPHAGVILAAALLAGSFLLSTGHAPSAIEKRAARVLSSAAGAGKVEVVIMMRTHENAGGRADRKGQGTPVGAIAVAQGADDPAVCLELQQALCSLLSLPASSVSVVAGRK